MPVVYICAGNADLAATRQNSNNILTPPSSCYYTNLKYHLHTNLKYNLDHHVLRERFQMTTSKMHVFEVQADGG